MSPAVTVIVPSTVERPRGESLLRALDSIRLQRNVATEIVVVANGQRCDEALLTVVRRLGARVVRLQVGNLPAAIHAGRLVVSTPYFSFLDDDDYYLEDALSARHHGLDTSGAAAVVTNGFNSRGEPIIADVGEIRHDPFRALLAKNWLASCGGLYRSSTIPPRLFEGLTKYFEWTVVAFRLLSEGTSVHFLDRLTYQLSDTPGSESKHVTPEAVLNGVRVAEDMLAAVPPRLRLCMKRKLADVYHYTSTDSLIRGDLKRAWEMHFLSIFKAAGWRYAAYTRQVVYQSLRHRTAS